MRSARLLAVAAVALLSVPGLIRAEDLTIVSDLDLLAKTREAVGRRMLMWRLSF